MNASVIKAELSLGKAHFCAKCGKTIHDRYLLKALDMLWHEDCLKCGCCNCRLGDVINPTLFTRDNTLLCRSDYLRLYGNTGLCSACKKIIPAFEMVMRAGKTHVFHLECFSCKLCAYRFCVGDRFYLSDNKILCETDYIERQLHTNNNNNQSINKNAATRPDGEEENMLKKHQQCGSNMGANATSTFQEKRNFSSSCDIPIHVR